MMWHCIYMKRPIGYLNHVFKYFCISVFFLFYFRWKRLLQCVWIAHTLLTVWCGGCGAVSITPHPIESALSSSALCSFNLVRQYLAKLRSKQRGMTAFWISDVRSESRTRSKQLVSALTSISQRDRCEKKWLVTCLEAGVCNDCCGWQIMSTVALCHSSCNTRSWSEDVVVCRASVKPHPLLTPFHC